MVKPTELQVMIGCVQQVSEDIVEMDDQRQELQDAIRFKEPTFPWLIVGNADRDDFFDDGYLYEAARNVLPQVLDIVYLEAARLAGEDLIEASKNLIQEINK